MRVLILPTLLSTTLILACAPAAPAEEPVDLVPAQAALLEADRSWADAYATADDPTAAIVRQLAEDVRLLAPEMPLVTGKESFGGVFEKMQSLPGFQLRWTPSTAEASSEADLGFTIGTYTISLDSPDRKPTSIEGKYLTVWRKQEDGSWKVIADMFNPNAPPGSAE